MANNKTYGIADVAGAKAVKAPVLPYEPRDPRRFRPAIGLIGCGGISSIHLRAYKAAGYNVSALCDVDAARAEARRAEFFPKAKVYSDYREVLRRDDIKVVDVATHPDQRVQIIIDALDARKHVLSQKPFVIDLDVGERLIARAHARGCKLAVNHNARWAPHYSYIRNAAAKGIAGDLMSAHFSVQWNHDWIADTVFNQVRHIILYDFGIHWFDLTNCLFGGRQARSIFASFTRAKGQRATPGLLAQAQIDFDGAQASFAFDGFTKFGARDTTVVVGTKGSLVSEGPDIEKQRVNVHTEKGVATPELKGTWFTSGFHGTMAELLCAIEEKREPYNCAESSLPGLALCFAAVASAESGRPQVPGKIRKLPKK